MNKLWRMFLQSLHQLHRMHAIDGEKEVAGLEGQRHNYKEMVTSAHEVFGR